MEHINNTGKFITIDGTDGSGKTTQFNLLVEKLKNLGYKVELADFPQYNTKSSGLVEEYLSGKYGTADEVGPYKASIFYACDRYDAGFKIKKWLNEGKIVISNRYVTSNMGHQGCKIEDREKRKIFLDWLYDLEYKLFNIPKPDLAIVLHVDAEIAQGLAQKREREDWSGKTRDIHEEDLNHLKKAEQTYLELTENYDDITLLKCTKDGQLLTKQEIHENVWDMVSQVIGYQDKKNTNNKIELKIEQLSPVAKIPTYGYKHDAAFDLYSIEYHNIEPGEIATVKTGIKMAIPEGFAGLIWDKSGVSENGVHVLAGVIDSGYRGEIMIKLINLGKNIYNIQPQQKVAQMLIQKVEQPKIIETRINDNTERGIGAFGSTGLF